MIFNLLVWHYKLFFLLLNSSLADSCLMRHGQGIIKRLLMRLRVDGLADVQGLALLGWQGALLHAPVDPLGFDQTVGVVGFAVGAALDSGARNEHPLIVQEVA